MTVIMDNWSYILAVTLIGIIAVAILDLIKGDIKCPKTKKSAK